MKHVAVLLCFLLLFFTQIEQLQATPIRSLFRDEMPSDAPVWNDVLAEVGVNRVQHPLYESYHRFLNDRVLPDRQRRFGNTKYGRSLARD